MFLLRALLATLIFCELAAVKIPQDLEDAKYISLLEKNDGFGSQLKRRMSAVAFAIFYNKTYVHLPFTKLQHNYNKDANYPSEMESFASIGLGFPLKEDLGDVNIYEREDFIYYVDQNVDLFYNDKVLALFKKNYYSSPKEQIAYFSKDHLNAAVHIRRGDVTDTGPMGMWMCDEHYLSIMERIRKEHPKVKFFIFSEGRAEDFEKFQMPDVELHLNEDIKKTFHALVSADILVTSKSAFSYTAALLSDGIIYYTNCWQPKLAHWIEVKTIRKR